MKRDRIARFAGGLAISGAAALSAYLVVVRPWHLRWGATDTEIDRALPLDDKVEHPVYVTNRAITIRARPEEIWPWLVQMGEFPRGGFYSYEWVERLMGMQVSNADRILPEFQHLEVGEALDKKGHMLVKAIEPNRWLVLGPPDLPGIESTWAMGLYPLDDEHTRMVSRVRARIDLTAKGLFWLFLLDPGQFVMERKWLLGIKQRVEARGKQRSASEKC